MSMSEWGRGNVFLRGHNYLIRYPDGNGHYRYESAHTTDERTARRLLDRRLLELEQGHAPKTARELKRTVNDLLDDLELYYRAHDKRSATNLLSVMKHVRAELGDRRANSITTADLEQYIVTCKEAHYAAETICRRLRHLKQAYKRQDSIPTPRFPITKRGKARDVLIAPAEQQSILDRFADPVFRDMTAFKFASGWRTMEVLTLQWNHIQADHIRLAEENSKTDEARTFPLVGTTLAIIARARLRQLPFCQYVFHTDSGQPLSKWTWANKFKRAARLAGLGDVTLHDTRRAFITDAVNAGIDSQVVRTLSGHKTNEVFERYRIVKHEQLAIAVQKREDYVASRLSDVKVVPLRAVNKP